MTYKEELIEDRIEYEKKKMLTRLEKDDKFINDICKQIGHLFRLDYVRNQKNVVSFYLISRRIIESHDLQHCYLHNSGQVVRFDSHFISGTANHIPLDLMLRLRYQLAKDWGLVFTQSVERESVKLRHINTGNLVTISFNKITLKLH